MMMLVLIKINHDVTLSASFTQSRKHNELEDYFGNPWDQQDLAFHALLDLGIFTDIMRYVGDRIQA